MFCCIHYALFLSIHKCISLRCSCFQWSAAVLFFLFLYLSFMKRRLTWAGYGAVGLWSRCCVWTLPPIDEHESLSPSPLTKRECKPHLWDHTGVPLVCTENKKKKVFQWAVYADIISGTLLKHTLLSMFRVLHNIWKCARSFTLFYLIYLLLFRGHLH